MKHTRWLGVPLAALLAAGCTVAADATHARAATCTQSGASGGCGPYSDPSVYADVNGADLVVQDVWNTPADWINSGTCGAQASCQTLLSDGDSSWTVAANYDTGDGSVKSFPDTQVTYTLADDTTPPVANFGTALDSSWANIDPAGAGLVYEYAYDIWLNPAGAQSWGAPHDQEIMVWTDNHGQTPAGDDSGQAYRDAAGVSWEIWLDNGSCSACTSTARDIVTFVRASNAATGSADLLGFIAYLKAHSLTTASASIDQIGYGPEICETGGTLHTFGLTSYTLLKKGAVPPPPPKPPVPPKLPAPRVVSLGSTRYLLWQPGVHAAGYDAAILNASGTLLHRGLTAGTWLSAYLGKGSYKLEVRYQVNGVYSPWSPATPFS
jgi:hypothetical protein